MKAKKEPKGAFTMRSEQPAFAKINLTLDITGVLPDRYHSIFTAMQQIDLCDAVTVETTEEEGITLTCTDGAVPCDETNTACRAADLFLTAAGVSGGVRIHIDKQIPSQAGLAGGSADAAATLRAMEALYPGKLTEQELLSIAFSIGADVPFCLTGGTQLCLNKGEVMAPLPPLRAWAVVVKPEADVSTQTAYRRFDTAVDLFHPDDEKFLYYAAAGEYKKALAYADNTFEELCEVPGGAAIKAAMYAGGAYYAAMSGSGSAYFGLFDEEEKAQATADGLRETHDRVWLCRTVG